MKRTLLFFGFIIGISQFSYAQFDPNGDIISPGSNSWLFHTPDDGRTSLFITPGTTGNIWDWSNSFEFKNNETLVLKKLTFTQEGSIYMDDPNWIRMDKDFFTPKVIRTDNQLQVGPNGDVFVVNSTTKNVGIGTTDPQAKLHVNGNMKIENQFMMLPASNQNNSSPGIIGAQDDNFLYKGKYLNHYGFGFYKRDSESYLRSYISDYFGIDFFAQGTHRMTIEGNGNVGIGTLNPDEKLTVKGKIHAEEVKVDLQIPADYVFQKYYTGTSTLKSNYQIPTLKEVEQFTKENHHLPDMPSAKEIQENGLQLGEIANLLLQKIEELTLYTIEQKKLIENQEKRIQELENKLKEK